MISINKWIITVNLETIATIESMMNDLLDDAEEEATAFTDDDNSEPYGCITCGNYDSGLYPDCMESCPMGDD